MFGVITASWQAAATRACPFARSGLRPGMYLLFELQVVLVSRTVVLDIRTSSPNRHFDSILSASTFVYTSKTIAGLSMNCTAACVLIVAAASLIEGT